MNTACEGMLWDYLWFGLLVGAAVLGAAESAVAGEAASASGSEVALQEIIVTAEKRSETVQNAPLSISVLSGVDLALENKTRMDEILDGVPGVQL
jgi:iron complex outermembrane receptor protein